MRNYGGSALMLFVTMAAAVGSYTINLKVSGERAAVDDLRRQIVSDARDMRNLQAELRTRARFPEMQRWNDSVLQMSAPSAQQYLRSPVQLASFGVAPPAPQPAQPDVRFAVTAPVPTAPVTDVIVRTAYAPQPAPAAALVRASYAATPRAGFAATPRVASYPTTVRRAAPVDTLTGDIDASLDAVEAVGAPRDLLPDGGQ